MQVVGVSRGSKETTKMADQPQISASNRKYVSPSFTNTDPDYSTIQNAINSLGSSYPNTPWGIYIYPGVYSESVTLKSNVSLIGAGINDVILKGTGSSPAITGPASDSGAGQCYICNITIDGNGQSAISFGNSGNQKTDFVIDVDVLTSSSPNSPALTIGNNQLVSCFGFTCRFAPTLFNNGIEVSGNGNLRMWQSTINTNAECLLHYSSQYSEFYNCILTSNGHTMDITSGTVNIYNSQTVGGIIASGNTTKVKHVESFHDGTLGVEQGAYMWISGMKWGEWVPNPSSGNIDIVFELSGTGSKIVVSNSRAGAQVASYVANVGNGCILKAFNSEFNNLGSGATITGNNGVTVYLYYCALNKNVTNVVLSSDSMGNNVFSTNSE